MNPLPTTAQLCITPQTTAGREATCLSYHTKGTPRSSARSGACACLSAEQSPGQATRGGQHASSAEVWGFQVLHLVPLLLHGGRQGWWPYMSAPAVLQGMTGHHLLFS